MVPASGRERLTHILKANIARSSPETEDRQELIRQMKQYQMYKTNYARNIVFGPTKNSLSELTSLE